MDNLLSTAISSDTRTNTHTVVFTGAFSRRTSAAVRASLVRLAQSGRDANWIIDTSRLTAVDSSAVTLLVNLDRHVAGGSVTVMPTPMLIRVLEAEGLAGRWTFAPLATVAVGQPSWGLGSDGQSFSIGRNPDRPGPVPIGRVHALEKDACLAACGATPRFTFPDQHWPPTYGGTCTECSALVANPADRYR